MTWLAVLTRGEVFVLLIVAMAFLGLVCVVSCVRRGGR